MSLVVLALTTWTKTLMVLIYKTLLYFVGSVLPAEEQLLKSQILRKQFHSR